WGDQLLARGPSRHPRPCPAALRASARSGAERGHHCGLEIETRMSESTIPLERRWDSWDAEHPAPLRYLPLGLAIDLCAYAASRNSFTRFPAGAEGLRLGPRDIDGNGIALDLALAGTRLRLAYDKPDPFTLRGRWQAGRLAEWGLRFWVMLAIRS